MTRLRSDHYARYRLRLRSALLDCPSVADPQRFAALFAQLPAGIRNALNTQLPSLFAKVLDLIDTCDNHPNGMEALLNAIGTQEDDESVALALAREEWRAINLEMDEQDRLIGWLAIGGVPFYELLRLYETAVPEGYAAVPTSIETLVTALWDVQQGHEALLTFCERVCQRPEPPDAVREALAEWERGAERNPAVRLASAAAVHEAAAEPLRIIVAVEEGIQDPNKRLVSLWVSDGERFENIDLKGSMPASQLREVVSPEIDDLLIVGSDARASIEVFVTKSLATLPVDTWEMSSGALRQRFSERYWVFSSILERQDARAVRTSLARTPSRAEKVKRLRKLKNSPFLKELVRRAGDWETRWQFLTAAQRLDDLTEMLQKIASPSVAEGKCLALLTFAPDNLESDQNDDPLSLVLIAGLPLIIWARSAGESEALAAHLKRHLIDPHCAQEITSAGDIVELVRHVRSHARDAQEDPHQLSHRLTLILDDPQSNLPAFFSERIPM